MSAVPSAPTTPPAPATPVAGPAARLSWLVTVTAERTASAGDVAAYRRAVRPELGDAEAAVASPAHPFVLAWRSLRDAVVVATGAGAGPEAAEPPPVVHLTQEIRQSRPVRAGERVSVDVDVLGARRDPRGTRLAVRSVLTGEDGSTFAELASGLLLIGASAPAPFGSVPASSAPGTPTAAAAETVTHVLPPDLPRRYAAASGDDNPIHLDRDRAVAAGYPGVIAHGMSVVALVCEDVVVRHAAGDVARVRGVGGRFSTPVVPGEQLDVELGAPGDGGVVRFSCRTPRGLAVKNGWVELG